MKFTHLAQAELDTLAGLLNKVQPVNLEHLNIIYQMTMQLSFPFRNWVKSEPTNYYIGWAQ